MLNKGSPQTPGFTFTISGMPRRKKEDTSFGPRLTAIRQARGMTQVQLAEATETTQRAVSYLRDRGWLSTLPQSLAWPRRSALPPMNCLD